mmetsp:Transcript_18126/g.58568  ORF Transcript_18126/g.58568 Transcript_18126/m.58568 type:complete len:86 (-) Transcript_18126:555-812(-)
MTTSTATFGAEIMLTAKGTKELESEIASIQKMILGVRTKSSTVLTHGETNSPSHEVMCQKHILRFLMRSEIWTTLRSSCETSLPS